MTRENDIIAAIDIGTTKIVAIAGRVNSSGTLKIIGLEKTVSKGVKRGVVHNIEETMNAINLVYSRLQDNMSEKITSVYVGIAGQHIRCVQSKQFKYIQHDIDEIQKQDVDDLLNENLRIPLEVGEQVLHIVPQDYVVDKESGIHNPIGMSGRRLDGAYNVIIGRTASARNIEKCVKGVGLDVNELVLEPLASSLAVLTQEEKDSGVVLVDIGGGTSDVAIYFDGALRHTAVIPFGGDSITKDIKEGCAVLVKQAESLKIQFGEAVAEIADDDKVVNIPTQGGWEEKEISFKRIALIIQSRMEEIIEVVQQHIAQTGLGDKLGSGIVLTGGGANLRNVAVLTREQTGLYVRIGKPESSSKIIIDEVMSNSRFATSIGLLIRGLEQESLKERKKEKEKEEEVIVQKEVKPSKKKGIRRLLGAFFDVQDDDDL